MSNTKSGTIPTRRVLLVATLAAFLLPQAQMVRAAIVGVDIEAGNGSPINWTSYTLADVGNTESNLIDENGAVTNISFQLSGPNSNQYFPPSSPTIIPSHSNDLTTVCCDVVAGGPEPYTTLWSGLVPNAAYDYWIFTSSASTDFFTITGSTTDNFVSSPIGHTEQRINGVVGSSSSTFASYSRQVNASASGTIVILQSATGTPTPSGYAVQLAIPEPASFTLLSLGLVAAGCLKRRRPMK